MVRRFLSREQTYSQLLKTVTDAEAKIDVLKRVNEELRTKLHALTLDSSNSQQNKSSVHSESTAISGGDDSEIIMMNNELGTIMKEYNRLGDRLKGVNIVNDQVGNWAKRVYNKFGVITQDEAFKEKPVDLVTTF